MSAYKRTDPGKLAKDRDAIRKSQESMAHPDHPAFEGVRKLFGALQEKIRSNYQNGLMQRDYGAPYGPRSIKTGGEEVTKPQPADLLGSYVTGFKKRGKVSA